MTARGSVTSYSFLIPHPREPRLLLLPSPAGWSLPQWSTPEQHLRHTVGHVNETMQRTFGLETTVLRQLFDRSNRETGQTQRVYAVENRSPGWTPPAGGRWVGKEMLEALRLAVPEHRTLLATWFSEGEEVPARRVPWARPGWYDDASAWVRDQSTRAGTPITGPVEQVRTWERSCILRASTESGEVYLKAVPSMFATEPPLTQALSERYPQHLSRVLAVEPDRGWLLMQGVPGKALDLFPEVRSWERALRAFARLQLDAASHVDQWLALGCPDRRLDHLRVAIGPLVEDPSVLLPGQAHGLSKPRGRPAAGADTATAGDRGGIGELRHPRLAGTRRLLLLADSHC